MGAWRGDVLRRIANRRPLGWHHLLLPVLRDNRGRPNRSHRAKPRRHAASPMLPGAARLADWLGARPKDAKLGDKRELSTGCRRKSADVRKCSLFMFPVRSDHAIQCSSQRASASPPPRGVLSKLRIAPRMGCLPSPALRSSGSSNPIAPVPPTGAIAFGGWSSGTMQSGVAAALLCHRYDHPSTRQSPSQTECRHHLAVAAFSSRSSCVPIAAATDKEPDVTHEHPCP